MATQAGMRITDPNELSTLKEGDIARVGKDIYRRDLAKEQEAMKTYTGDRTSTQGNEAFNNSVYGTPKISAPSDISNPPSANNLNLNPPPTLPETTADTIKRAFIESATSSLPTQKSNLNDVYIKQNQDLQKQIDDLNKSIADNKTKELSAIEQSKPENLPYASDITKITQDRLNAAKSASATLEKNFTDNQNSISEMEQILTDVNASLSAEKSKPGRATDKNIVLTKLQTDGTARVGVIQAVMAARNGQISQAQSLINNAYTSVNSAKQDSLNYYNSILNFYSNSEKNDSTKLANVTNEQKSNIESQIKLLTNDIGESQKVKDTILNVISNNPTMADKAGLKLTDTLEETNKKIADYQAKYGGIDELRSKYFDAGILATDTFEQARQKVISNSAIYRKDIKISGSGSASSNPLNDETNYIEKGYNEGDILQLKGKTYVVDTDGKLRNPTADETSLINGTPTSEEKTFNTDVQKYRDALIKGGEWGTQYDLFISKYPDYGKQITDEERNAWNSDPTNVDNQIQAEDLTWADAILGKSQYQNQ